MWGGTVIEPENQGGVLSIHFDVQGHEIPLSTFVETAQQTAAVIEAFNLSFFDGDLSYQLVILSPENGSFKSKLKFVVGGGLIAVWAFVNTPVGAAFIEGLTEHTPAHWAEKAGENLRLGLADILFKGDLTSPDEPDDPKGVERFTSILVVEITKGFLTKSTAELESAGIGKKKFRSAYEARNEFYQSCLRLPDLRGMGFEDTPLFPVDRQDFVRLQVALPPKEEDEEPWLTGTSTLKVTSPNWDRNDKLRNWKAKDERGRERFFRIEDEYFWRLVREERLSTHIIDTIKVQWAFRGTVDSPKGIRVLRVIEFNGEVISEPLNEDALLAFLGKFSVVTSSPGQQNLFD